MKRESRSIKDFKGIVKNVNLPLLEFDFAYNSNNVDGNAPEGLLRFINQSATISSTVAKDYKRGILLKLNDGSSSLIYVNDSNVIKGVNNFYTAKNDAGISVSRNAYSFIADREAVYIATNTTPLWIGKINYNVFNFSPPSGFYVSEATLPKPSNSSGNFYIFSVTTNASSGDSVFELDYRLSYKISIEYDYNNETVLSSAVTIDVTQPISSVNIKIRCVDGYLYPSNINKRITAIKLYRKDISLKSTVPQETLYKLIKRLPTNSMIQEDFNWVYNGDHIEATITDNNSADYGSYESQTGISEAASSVDMSYKLACAINNRLYVGNCTKTGVASAHTMIFRSKEYRYSMFDWATLGEYIKLPSIPTAMVNYNGKLWVFDYNHIYKINPDLMVIEDTIEGIGCFSQESVTVTDYGLFWCDSKNAYWHNGSYTVNIGDLIRQTIGEWHGFPYVYGDYWQEYYPYVKYAPQINSVLFIIFEPETNYKAYAWIWNITKERWDKSEDLVLLSNYSCGAFTGEYGEIYISTGSELKRLFWNSNRATGYWESGVVDGGDISQLKKWYLIKWEGEATVQYSIDGESFKNLVNGNEIKDANGKWRTGKYLRVKINSNGTNSYVKNLTVIYRPIEGKR